MTNYDSRPRHSRRRKQNVSMDLTVTDSYICIQNTERCFRKRHHTESAPGEIPCEGKAAHTVHVQGRCYLGWNRPESQEKMCIIERRHTSINLKD